jgi:hypothetical protein
LLDAPGDAKLAFAVVLRIQSCVEQLCEMVQGRGHGGRVFLGSGVVMASSQKVGAGKQNTRKSISGCQSYWWVPAF